VSTAHDNPHATAQDNPDEAARAAVDAVWREHAGSMLGVLAKRLGDLDRAEEALQDAVAEALRVWVDGPPPRPAGWLVTTAWRKAVDALRRDATGARLTQAAALSQVEHPEPTGDDRLALIFACCHPSLPRPAQVALTLHAASGLSTEEIAAAFLIPVPTMAQRLVRAKRRLRDEGVRFAVPEPGEYPQRLAAVLAVVYLVFNEGYLSSGAPQRRELAREGLDLARQLALLLPDDPEPAGLAALIELHEARAAARFDADGGLVLLEEQDRTRWDQALIRRAVERLGQAMARDRPGPYQLQAAIAAQHALAPSFDRTDWSSVRDLYDLLHAAAPSPVVLLNRAVATRFVLGPEAALAEADALAGALGEYRLLHATRAEFLRALGRGEEATDALQRALAMATNPAERDLLRRRLA
jgi:RNA polymerase sigma-70 factor (ECF subfamily)